MDDLVDLDDYRELATFLEEKIADADANGLDEVDEVRARLARLREILNNPDRLPEHPEHGRDSFEAAVFDLKMKRSQPHGQTLEDLERKVTVDLGNDVLRKQYLEEAEAAGAQLRAAETLSRALSEATRPDVKERVGFEVALLYLGEGELPQARNAFLDVVRAGAAGTFALSAARRLLNLQVDTSDPEVVGPARELIAKADPDAAARQDAAEAILSLHATTPQPDSRLAVAYRALVASPRSDEAIQWLRRFYANLGGKDGLVEWLEHAEHWEPLAKVLAADLELAPQKDRGRLYARLGHVRLVRLGDSKGALPAFARALTLDPAGAPDATLAAIRLAYANLHDRDRHDLMLRTARALSRNDQGPRAIALCKELFVEPSLEPSVVQEIAEIAHDEDDKDLHRYALELLSRVGDADVRKAALERLGDFQFTQLGDRRAAAESWRPAAAHMYDGTPAEKEHAQQLYERVLEALPDDRDAAQRLAELYAQSDDWTKLPEVLRVLLRTDGDAEASAGLLLRLEKSAIEAGEVGPFVSLVEEVIGRLGSAAPSKSWMALKRARARALGSDTARSAETSAAYREIIESSGSDEDVRAFEAFVESRPSAEERHQERRRLYEWRVTHGTRAAEVLLEWARAEEEVGASEAAIALYVRLSELAPGQREGLEALCRLKIHTGDFEGGLAALRSLRETGNDAERRAVTLQMARVLLEDLGRPAEAAVALAPLLDVAPPIPAVRQMMKRTLADPSARTQVAEHIEQLAQGEDPAAARRVFQFLIEARHETASMTEARRRWFERLVELSVGDRRATLTVALQGAIERPEATALWEHAERIVREGKQPDLAAKLSKAYYDVLVERAAEPAVAEAVARRMIAFSGECGLPDSPQLVEALQKFLETSPGARWALDRVKLVLGSQARWDELFRLYDGAIAATASDDNRGQLLDEAACAAKDLASQPERAIPYLESIHAMRPDDATAAAALERLYERQGRTRALLDLLAERLDKASGFKRRELLDRIASLWVDIGAATQAFDVAKRMMGEGAAVADLVGLLERIAGDPAHPQDAAEGSTVDPAAETRRRAVELLRARYQDLDQTEDVVRMTVRQLSLTENVGQRTKSVRELIDVCRRSRSALDPHRRRELLREGATICAERLADREGAIRLFADLFEENAGDEVATGAVDAYAALLTAAGDHSKLARFWEAQGRSHGAAKNVTMQRACWERAARLWEDQGARSEAIGAYGHAAALDSHEAFEGLARIHRSGGEWAAAAEALEWLSKHSPPATRGQRALEVAEAYVSLGEGDRARARLEEALEAGVEKERAEQISDTLMALYRKDGAYRPLAQRLVVVAGATRDPDKKLALLLEAADLLRSKADAPAEAVALLEKAVALRPNDGALRPSLAEVLESLERWDRAAEVLRDQIGWFGSQRTRERALTHHRLASALLRASRQKEALAELRLAAEMLPAHPGVLYQLARAALDAGELDLAEGTYRALLLALHHPTDDAGAPAPHRAEVFLDLSEIALQHGDSLRAADLVDSAVDVALESGDRPERFEPVLSTRGRYDLLARAIERRVDRGSTLEARAAALGDLVDTWARHEGRGEELRARIARHAERIGRELEQEGTTDAVAWAALASVHASLGDEAASAAANRRLGVLLESAISKAAPGTERARLRVSFARATLTDASQIDRTIAMLSAALEDEPANDEAVELLSGALSGAGRLDEARQALEKLLTKSPTHAGALERVAALAAAASDWDAAIDAYRKLLPGVLEAGKASRIALALAEACDRAGKPDDARDALERALGLAPQNLELTERLTQICERTGDWARLTHLWVAQAEKQVTETASAQLLVRGGVLLLEKARVPAEALRLAELARAASAESVEASLLWARVQLALGRPREALSALEEVIHRNRGKRTPLVARVCLEAANAHLALDELVEAHDLLKAAFGMDARSSDVAMLLALVSLDLDDERTAERALFAITGAAARTDADKRTQAAAFYHLAAAAYAKGDGGKARRLIVKALAAEPGHAASQALLERLDANGSAVVKRGAVGPASRVAVSPSQRTRLPDEGAA